MYFEKYCRSQIRADTFSHSNHVNQNLTHKAFHSLRIVSFFIFLVVFLFPENHTKNIFAAGVILDSIGAISAGRGGTNISHADNGVLIHDNPAGLVNMSARSRLELSVEFLYPEARYEDPLDIDYSKHEIFTLPTFSYTYKKNGDSRFAFGVGLFAPAGFSTEYHLEYAGFLDQRNNNISRLYRSDAQLLKLLFSASYTVETIKGLSVGLSAGPTYLSAELESPYTFQTGALTGSSALVDMDTDNFGFCYSAGIQYNIAKINTTIGLAFVSESKTTLRGDADVFIPDIGLGAEYDVKTNFEWPRSIGFGISHQLKDSHRFSADVVWFNWKSAFDRLHLELTDGDNPLLNGMLGGEINDVLPLDWDDAFAYRFGYEYFLNLNKANDIFTAKDIFRVGYVYNENPIPSDTLIPLINGTTKHNFNFGHTHKWEHWELNSAFEFATSDNEFVEKSSLVGGDFDDSELKAKVYTLSIGFAYRF